MGYYPIAFDVTNKPCLVVGGGEIALRKVESLIASGAKVTVISPEIDHRISSLGVDVAQKVYQTGDCKGFALVFAATGNRTVNIEISREAEAEGILVNVVDDPELCTFIVPAVVRRGDLMIAITTSGQGPALSKRIRRRIEELFGDEYGPYVALLGEVRNRVKELYNTQPEREAAMNRVLNNPDLLQMIKDGREEEARESALSCI